MLRSLVGSEMCIRDRYTGTFLRTRSYQEITCEGARALSGPCEAFAGMELSLIHI